MHKFTSAKVQRKLVLSSEEEHGRGVAGVRAVARDEGLAQRGDEVDGFGLGRGGILADGDSRDGCCGEVGVCAHLHQIRLASLDACRLIREGE